MGAKAEEKNPHFDVLESPFRDRQFMGQTGSDVTDVTVAQ